MGVEASMQELTLTCELGGSGVQDPYWSPDVDSDDEIGPCQCEFWTTLYRFSASEL